MGIALICVQKLYRQGQHARHLLQLGCIVFFKPVHQNIMGVLCQGRFTVMRNGHHGRAQLHSLFRGSHRLWRGAAQRTGNHHRLVIYPCGRGIAELIGRIMPCAQLFCVFLQKVFAAGAWRRLASCRSAI